MVLDEKLLNNTISEIQRNAWNRNDPVIKYITDGNDILKLEGFVFESSYEMFQLGIRAYFNDELLFNDAYKEGGLYKDEKRTLFSCYRIF